MAINDRFESFLKLENKEAVIADLESLKQEIQEGVIKELKAGGHELTKGLKDSLPVAQTEADLASSDTEDTIVSAPGSAPMVQSEELRDSIFSKIMPLMLSEAITLKISTLKYGFYGRMLEFGTSKMAARPWFYSGLVKVAPYLKDRLEGMLSEMVKRRNEMRGRYVRGGKMTGAQALAAASNDIAKLTKFTES